MKKNLSFLIALFLSYSSILIGQKRENNDLVITYDVTRNKIIALEYYHNNEKKHYSQNNDSIKSNSIITYEITGEVIKVRNYSNYLLTDSIIRQKINDTTYVSLRPTTDKFPCNGKHVICIHDKYGQLIEKKVFYEERKFLFKRKRIIFWHKYFYLKNYIP